MKFCSLLPLRRGGNSNAIAGFFFVAINFFDYSIHRAADEAVVICTTPLSGIPAQISRTLEASKNLLGQELIRSQRRVSFDPVIGHDEETAETAGLFFQS